jgi:plastocyanin
MNVGTVRALTSRVVKQRARRLGGYDMTTSIRNLLAALTLAIGLATVLGSTTGFAAVIKTITIMDQCDPATFNAAVGDGTCVGNPGGVPFDMFISQLQHHQFAGAWHFAPDPLRLVDGELFKATNHGGEAHTFTEVDEFGGGFVPQLNALAGGLTETPECAAVAAALPAGLVLPGQSTSPEDEEPGVHHYQCCIHPWMHTDVIVR